MSRDDHRGIQRRTVAGQPRHGFKIDGVIKGSQGNFDHLQGLIEHLAEVHNSLVDDVDDLGTVVGGSADHSNRRISELEVTLSATAAGAFSGDHDDLTNVTSDQHHTEDHELSDGDHTDVNAPTPSDEDVLTWDSGTSKWIAAPAAAASLVDVEDDTVPVASASTIDFGAGLDVTDDGGGHVTVDANASASAHDILSVTHSDTNDADTPVEGDLLRYTGTEWEAAAFETVTDPVGDEEHFGAYVNRIITGYRNFSYIDCMADPQDGDTDSGWKLHFTGAVGAVAGESGHPGVWKLSSTAASTTQRITAGEVGSQASILSATGRTIVGAWLRIPTASDVTNEFRVFVGLHTQSTLSYTSGSCLGLMYHYNQNSGNWEGFTLDVNSPSTDPLNDNGGSIAAADNAWHHLQVRFNAAGAVADFYIDNVLKGTISGAGLPSDVMSPVVGVRRIAGTTQRDVYLDGAYALHEMTTPR